MPFEMRRRHCCRLMPMPSAIDYAMNATLPLSPPDAYALLLMFITLRLRCFFYFAALIIDVIAI